jgi:fibronectin-binding autotransporter adhesin
VTVNSSSSYTFGGSGRIGGAISLIKNGSGGLTLNTTNTHTGGTILSNGTIYAGSLAANSLAFGTGAFNFYGGTLEFSGFTGGNSTDAGGNTNAIFIPTGQTGTIRVPQRFLSSGLGGPLTGGGTLNLVMKYVRGDLTANCSAFTGKINVLASTGGTTTDDFRVKNGAGFPNAKLNLGSNILMYAQGSGYTLTIGEFSATNGASVVASGTGSSAAAVQHAMTIRAGRLNTDTTNAALFTGLVTLVKEGTGKWTLTRDNTYSGTTTVSNGTLFVNGNQTSASGSVTVASLGTLGGTGTIGGATTVNGILAPGQNSLGTLAFAGNLTLGANATATLGLSKNPIASDLVTIGGTLTLNGTLDVVNVSPEFLAAGDSFQLFSATTFSGNFATVNLPALDTGLAWNTSTLRTNGIISVVAVTPPVLDNLTLTGSNLTFSASGSVPGGTFWLLASPDLALPLANWTHVTTNTFDGNGSFNFSNALAPGSTQQFYRVVIP